MVAITWASRYEKFDYFRKTLKKLTYMYMYTVTGYIWLIFGQLKGVDLICNIIPVKIISRIAQTSRIVLNKTDAILKMKKVKSFRF